MEMYFTKTCCFTGHRPDKCVGTEEAIRGRLLEKIREFMNRGYDTFITGMAMGVDTWAAEEVLKIKEESPAVRLVCAVPFLGVERNRTEEQQKSFRAILEKADIVEYICPKGFRRSFPARDKWMVDHASGVIAVFNGTHGGTEYTIRYAREKERLVEVINDADCSEPQNLNASKTVR